MCLLKVGQHVLSDMVISFSLEEPLTFGLGAPLLIALALLGYDMASFKDVVFPTTY